MRMLLTSNGVHEGAVLDALLDLLEKPISEARTVVVLDAMLPFPGDKSTMLRHLEEYRALAPVLRELLDEKVYIGLSAGSMIFSTLHAAVIEALDDRAEVEMLELDSVGPALPLFDWFVFPHLGAPYFPGATDEWAAQAAARLEGEAWFLDDASALLVRDPASAPEVVSDGHWLHFDAAAAPS